MNLKSKFNKLSSRVSRKLGAYPGLRTYVLSLFCKKVVIDNKEEMMEELKRYPPPRPSENVTLRLIIVDRATIATSPEPI